MNLFNRKAFTISELVLVFFVVVIITSLMLPAINYNRRKLQTAVCANNLRKAGLALYIYAKEHDGRFPENLKTLYDEEYLSDKTLMDCPADKSSGVPENPDYLYTSGLSVRDASMAHLVEERAGSHGHGGNILYVNGSVAWEESV